MPSIYIVGDYYSEEDETNKRPFSGTYGHILRGILSQAGIPLSDVTLDAAFRLRPANGRLESLLTNNRANSLPGYPPIKRGNYISADFALDLQRLHHRIDQARPNIIVPLGGLALLAITKKKGIEKFRGSPLMSADNQFKVLPTWGPDSVVRQWNLRPIVFMDFCKIREEAKSPLLIRPRRIIHLNPTLADIEAFYHEHIVPSPLLACDIETKNNTITEVGFATSISRCLVIPFWKRAAASGNYWKTAAEEKQAWDWVRRILAEKKVIGQNFQYDMQYLSRTVGIPSPGFTGDTMLLHHSLQPELQKSLGFLGSIYTSEPSWKFMRTDHSTLKKEDE